MPRFILILAIGFLIGAIYSYFVQRFTSSKFIIFLPSIAGVIWIFYLLFTFTSQEAGGFYDLAVFLMAVIITSLILGNLITGLILLQRKKT